MLVEQETTARFESLQQCIIDQYSNYSVSDVKGKKYYVQAKITNGEDMADAGGIEQSFRAWKDRFESDREGRKYDNYLLPGLDQYSREQLFFIGECKVQRLLMPYVPQADTCRARSQNQNGSDALSAD